MITAWIGSIAFLSVAILYVLLVFGLPYGEYAMGGKYKVAPKRMRAVYAISIVIQLFAIMVLLQTGRVISIGFLEGIATGACYVFAVYLSLNTVMNAVSKSRKEKIVMTPLSLVTAVCFWVTAING